MRILKKITIHLAIIMSMSFLVVIYLYQPIPKIDDQSEYQHVVESQVEYMMDRYDIPGVQLTIFESDQENTYSFGYKDLDEGMMIDDQSVFRAQSLSKTVTAVLILKLVEENYLSLDDQLRDLLSNDFLEEIPSIYHDVTIHQILKHEAYMPLGDFNRMYALDDDMMSLEEALIYDLNQNRPNGGFLYSNVGYNLLEYVINKVYEDGYEQLAKTYLFDPLEMTHTSFSYDEIDHEKLVYGYDQFKDKVDHYRYPELGSGGLLSTSSDFYKFLFGLVNGDIISLEHLDLLLSYDKHQSLGSYGLAFDGYGYGVFVEQNGEHVTFSHGGQGSGFMAFYHVDLESQSGYVVMSNSQRTYPLISMLSTTINDANELDAPGIKNIHLLMIIFEVIISISLYLFMYIMYVLFKEKWIKNITTIIVLSFLWILMTFLCIYFYLGNYMFIHVLIPLHFEIFMRTLVLINISLLLLIISSIINLIKKKKSVDVSLKEKVISMKRDIVIVGIALKNKHTPWYAKFMFFITMVYALSPIDLIPDFIPIVGYLDDLLILPALLRLSVKLIPDEVYTFAQNHYETYKDTYTKKTWIYAIPFLILWIYIGYLILRFVFVI